MQVNLPESGDDPRTLVKVSFVEPAQVHEELDAQLGKNPVQLPS